MPNPQFVEKNTINSKTFFKKIFLPFYEVRVYVIILSAISFFSSWLIEAGGFLSFPYGFMYIIPTTAIFAWPVTVAISWFVGSLIVKIQKKILPNGKGIIIGIIIIISSFLLLYFFIHKYPLRAVKILPLAFICEIPEYKTDKNECNTLLALKKNDLKICEKTNTDKTSCYERMAYQNDNMDICNLLAQDGYAKVEACFLSFAQKKEDWRICNKLNSKDKIECYAIIEYHKKGDVCDMLAENGDFTQVQQCKDIINYLKTVNDR